MKTTKKVKEKDTIKIDIRRIKENIRKINSINTNAKYVKFLKRFYRDFLADLECEAVKKREKGDSNFKVKHFKERLKQLFEKIHPRLDVKTESEIPLRDKLGEIFGISRIDLKISNPRNEEQPVFYIEIKYSLRKAMFGAAYLEAVQLHKRLNDRFILISFWEDRKLDNPKFNKALEVQPFADYIDHIACFGLEYDNHTLQNVLDVLNDIELAHRY